MNIKTFIIHLERASERRKQVEILKQQSSLPVEVINAVDGAELSANTVKTVYRDSLHKPRYPFKLRVAEVACFLSHRKCWQAILDQNLDAALILEDDVELDQPVFSSAFELALQNFTTNDYIRFPFKQREIAATTRATTSTQQLFFPRVIGLGMQGQLVGKGAASTLLDKTQTFDRPVDTLLQMSWLTGVWPLSVSQAGISEKSSQLGGSRISKHKSWGEALRREILRPLYRRKLAALALANGTSHKN